MTTMLFPGIVFGFLVFLVSSTAALTSSTSQSLTPQGTTAPTSSTSQSLTPQGTTAPTSSTSQSLTPQGTTVPAPASATSAHVTVSMTTTLTSTQPSSINSDGRSSGGELIGAVVAGWVLALMLAVLLAVLGVLLLRRHGGCGGLMQYLKGKPTSGPPATSRDDNVDVNSLEVIPDPYHVSHQVRRAPTYVNAASRQSTADNEYVNAAADLGRPTSQLEYSPLEWSRDQNTTYSPLNVA